MPDVAFVHRLFAVRHGIFLQLPFMHAIGAAGSQGAEFLPSTVYRLTG
jgi:hypothetical protein